MATSQNGWPVLLAGDRKLVEWQIPAKSGAFHIRLRHGSAGFILAHFILWFSETIEKVLGPQLDDWGHAVRPVRGKTSGYSNHASGTAFDMNATQHPLGKRGTYAKWKLLKMKARLKVYRGTIRLGAFYAGRPDEMHGEINADFKTVKRVSKILLKSSRGKRLIAANPKQLRIINL